jgi:hypothetical protein
MLSGSRLASRSIKLDRLARFLYNNPDDNWETPMTTSNTAAFVPSTGFADWFKDVQMMLRMGDLDGDNSAEAFKEHREDGYSIDDCYDMWAAGKTPLQAQATVIEQINFATDRLHAMTDAELRALQQIAETDPEKYAVTLKRLAWTLECRARRDQRIAEHGR